MSTIRMGVTPKERAIILALRADPDQERHIVDFDGHYGVTVRHPLSERLAPNDLFGCPALTDAIQTVLAAATVGNPFAPGRYRMSDEVPGEMEKLTDG